MHTRSLSHYITLPDKTSSSLLRIPLLKSPSYFGHFSSRVNRPSNEDRYSAALLNVNHGIFSFGVYDGHGGDQCSEYLAKNLASAVENHQRNDMDLAKKYAKSIGGYWKRWYKHRADNFGAAEKQAVSVQGLSADLNVRLFGSYLAADYAFFGEGHEAGSTCTCAYLETLDGKHYFQRGTVSKLTISHVGDTKAILVDRNGVAHALTQAHHPSNPNEASRLRKYATNFFMTDSFGEERFIALANTRAFGDIKFKEMGVSAEPEFTECVVGDSKAIEALLSPEEVRDYTVGGLGGDESFLVLISDGVTGVLTDQEVADVVMSHYNLNGSAKSNPQKCAEEVVKFVEYVGGDDNATCLVVRLGGWGKWPEVDRTGELRQSRMDDYNPRKGRT